VTIFKRRKKRLLSEKHRRQIREAIQQAERQTSGEIRVVLEALCQGDPYERALEHFAKLGMIHTRQRNGVLVYVALKDRKFALVGDEGIHRHVGDQFWQEVAETMCSYFQKGQVIEGIRMGVLRIGEVLSRYFPSLGEADLNELPDEVVEGP